MKTPRPNRSLVYALYANAALLLAILIALLARGTPSAFAASAPQPIAGNGNLYLMPGQLLSNVWGCYVLDIENQTLCAYAYSGSQLQLKCARSIRYDHELENYNTLPPPSEIQTLVERQKGKMRGPAVPETTAETQPSQANPQPAPAPAPEVITPLERPEPPPPLPTPH